MQDSKEEVRARLGIEDVVGEYVQLKRAGRNFKGLSPFSGEKTASFFVSPDKQIWHDFSSNKGGDIFSFVMEVEGMDFRGALEHLARKAGVDLSLYDSKNGQDTAKRKKRAFEALNLAADYYQRSMLKNRHALEYIFKKRGLTKEIVTEFRIGYAPSQSDALVGFLGKKGFSTKEINDAGLANRFGGDLFRGRMTVPLMDATGQVIGFTARILEDEPNAPKYLNTPQTILYDKSRHVFGLSQAKEAIRKSDEVVIVEGNMDVISSHQAGVKNVVATAGTAMTPQHIQALKRLTSTIRLCFDGDKAGIAATERAIPIASDVGIDLTIVTLPGEAKDPDELIQKDVALWQQAIGLAEPAVDWVIAQYAEREDISTASGKRTFTTAALTVVGSLSDAVERDHYEQKIAELTNASIESIRHKVEQTSKPTASVPLKTVAKTGKNDTPDSAAYQDNALAVALIDPTVHDLFTDDACASFSGDDRQAVARYVATKHQPITDTTPAELQQHDTYVKILLLKADARYADWNDHDRYFETARLLRHVVTEHIKRQKEDVQKRLREAEAAHDDALIRDLLEQITALNKEITHGKK